MFLFYWPEKFPAGRSFIKNLRANAGGCFSFGLIGATDHWYAAVKKKHNLVRDCECTFPERKRPLPKRKRPLEEDCDPPLTKIPRVDLDSQAIKTELVGIFPRVSYLRGDREVILVGHFADSNRFQEIPLVLINAQTKAWQTVCGRPYKNSTYAITFDNPFQHRDQVGKYEIQYTDLRENRVLCGDWEFAEISSESGQEPPSGLVSQQGNQQSVTDKASMANQNAPERGVESSSADDTNEIESLLSTWY